MKLFKIQTQPKLRSHYSLETEYPMPTGVPKIPYGQASDIEIQAREILRIRRQLTKSMPKKQGKL